MTPQRTTNGTLTDLLDRVLDKGLVIHADVIVSVAGIPLIGVNLRAALAGMETMLKYGMMQAWDERTRAWENDHRKKKDALIAGEKVRLRMLGAIYLKEGIIAAWRYACFYLTDERLLLYHRDFNEILFEVPLGKIEGLFVREGDEPSEKGARDELCLLIEGEEMCRLRASDVHQLKASLQTALEETETNPGCGNRGLRRELLAQGCWARGGISPIRKERTSPGIKAALS